MIVTKNISHIYLNAEPINVPDISLKQGEEALIIGKSGCGKSTLLHILGGLLVPTNGEVMVSDQSVNVLMLHNNVTNYCITNSRYSVLR